MLVTQRISSLQRRDVFRILGASCFPGLMWPGEEPLPAVRAITRGPKFHWFGYYDKLQFDPTGRYALGNQVDFEHRYPGPNDAIKVGMVDLNDGDRWIELGESRAWNWQQGCMLQWLPGSKTEVIWNDRQGSHFVSYILDVKTRKKRTLPGPIYAVSPDARWAVAPDFSRLNIMRPGYGYCGVPDPYEAALAPKNTGIWRMDLDTGKRRLIIPFAEMPKLPYPEGEFGGAKHWYNHLLVSPGGKRFVFLHRWRLPSETRHTPRLLTADAQGHHLFALNPVRMTSHFSWRDATHLIAYAYRRTNGNRFYLFEDLTGKVEVLGRDVMTSDGHCSYLPGGRWILNDTYPDKQRNQTPYLFDTRSGKRFPLGHFYLAPEYSTDKPFVSWRCDLHPRSSPDGRKVIIDSPHEGGRQMYLIDIGGIVG